MLFYIDLEQFAVPFNLDAVGLGGYHDQIERREVFAIIAHTHISLTLGADIEDERIQIIAITLHMSVQLYETRGKIRAVNQCHGTVLLGMVAHVARGSVTRKVYGIDSQSRMKLA